MKRVVVLILVAVHFSSATVDLIKDIHNLKRQAVTNIQQLAETASTNFKYLTDAATAKLTNVKNVATPLIENIKVTADTNFKNWQSSATTNFQNIKDIASVEFQNIQEKTARNVQKIADSIDFGKLQQLDFLNIIPLVENGKKMLHDENYVISNEIPMVFDPHQGERLRYYFQKVHGDKGQKLISALGTGLPFVVLRRIDVV